MQANAAVLALNDKVSKLCQAHQDVEVQLSSVHTPFKSAVFDALSRSGEK